MTTFYRVRFRKPNGEEAWLGEAGCGSTTDEEKAPLMYKEDAEHAASERNLVHGPRGYSYWIVPFKFKTTEINLTARP